jgi:hypothetical protein
MADIVDCRAKLVTALQNSTSRTMAVLGVLAFLLFSASAWSAPPLQILEKELSFPAPVQWKAGDVEISLIALAWGPANSPRMIAKGRDVREDLREKPTFFSDRPYVLALRFRARTAMLTSMYSSSGLIRIKDIEGDLEGPVELTPLGFVPFSGAPGIYDLHFDKTNITEYWEFFPVANDQKEFLFRAPLTSRAASSANEPNLSFRIILQNNDFVITTTSSRTQTACQHFTKNFAGTIGADANANLHLVRENTTLSGTEQYTRIGKTLWLGGTVDADDHFEFNELYPKNSVSGIFKGRFSQQCQVMTGYFSKPDGTRLQPFEFHEVGSTRRLGPSNPDSQEQ